MRWKDARTVPWASAMQCDSLLFCAPAAGGACSLFHDCVFRLGNARIYHWKLSGFSGYWGCMMPNSKPRQKSNLT